MLRPLSDPGVLGRVAPFAGVAIIAVVLAIVMPPSSPDRRLLAAAAVLTALVIVVALCIPWARIPAAWQVAVPLSYFAVIGLLRQAEGGEASGFAPLVVLPVLWIALYGSRSQLGLVIAGSVATFLVPLFPVGSPPHASIDTLAGVLRVVIILFTGFAIQTLVGQSRQRTADVAALGVATRALGVESDPRPALCAAARLVTGAAFAILFEPHPDGTLVATAGTDGLNLASMQINPATEASATAEAWRTGERIYIADTITSPRASTRLATATGAVGVLFQPITRDGRRMAVLVVGFPDARRRGPESALHVVELLAAEIGAALDRADLVARLAVQARTDPLTGASNRRSWDEQLDRELARAQRTADPLTVAMLDLDHFKVFNDAFGHSSGDALLRDFVVAIRAELRTGDVVARWGGEEFVLALPSCDLERARTVATRLLSVVPSGQTVSIGLTQAREHDTPRTLISRADLALYAAKDGGRNQVRSLDALVSLDDLSAAGPAV